MDLKICEIFGVDYDTIKSDLDLDIDTVQTSEQRAIHLIQKFRALDRNRNQEPPIKHKLYNTEFKSLCCIKNIKNTKKDMAKKCNDFLSNPSDSNLDSIASSIMSDFNKRCEIIKYKLLYYEPTILTMTKSNHKQIAPIIKQELDSVIDIIEPYVEDTRWKINYKRELNFKVESNMVVFSNTVKPVFAENDFLITYLDIMMMYLRRMMGCRSINYTIEEDNKYDIFWLLIVVPVH